MTQCNVNGVFCSDEPTDIYHPNAVPSVLQIILESSSHCLVLQPTTFQFSLTPVSSSSCSQWESFDNPLGNSLLQLYKVMICECCVNSLFCRPQVAKKEKERKSINTALKAHSGFLMFWVPDGSINNRICWNEWLYANSSGSSQFEIF